jgi:hypothetical protein
MENIEFAYLYRDGGNYKSRSTVVFCNPERLSPSAIALELRQAFLPDGLFIAHQISLPEVFLYGNGNPTSDDHCFHEFDSVEMTSDSPNDQYGRSVGQFMAEVAKVAQTGWRAFDPPDRPSLRKS